jgi:hypothetical protein
VLHELARRRWAATEALAYGRGGISAVARATGLSRPTIRAGIREMRQGEGAAAAPETAPRRRPGVGRTRRAAPDPRRREDRERLVEPTPRGDPQSPLRWTCKSGRRLAAARQAQGHQVSPQLVRAVLHAAGYRLPGARQPREGAQPPDRQAPFEHIAAQVRDSQKRGEPVISVDAKQQELVGDCKNTGRAWHPHGQAPQVRVDAVVDPAWGKAIPSGVSDVHAHVGWVSVGVAQDTPAFAVATLRTWWLQMGWTRSPQAKERLITADSGGSNSARAAVAAGVAALRRGERSAHPRQSSAPGHEPVDQHRAPPVLPHHGQLAWQATGEPGGGGQSRGRDHDDAGPAHPGGSGRWPLSHGCQRQ